MASGFDVIIVGSGPAGISAAIPLAESGLRVLMVDGGGHASIAPPTKPFLDSRTEDVDQWKWMIGEDYHALRNIGAVSPKLRVPTHGYVFEKFNVANRIAGKNFVTVGSLATGGLSNAWGCGVACFSQSELEHFPFPASELNSSIKRVATRIGISGGCIDDMSDFFGLDAWASPPIEPDLLHQYLLRRYVRQRNKLINKGFCMGRSRVAVLSENQGDRRGCERTGNCMWGCNGRSLYSALYDMPTLRKWQNFSEKSNFVVTSLIRHGKLWGVEGTQRDLSGTAMIMADKVILAAGTLASTRIALAALKYKKTVALLSCPIAAFLLWLPACLGVPRVPAFGFGQLSYSLALTDDVSGFGSTFATTGIPVSEFLCHLPFCRRNGIDLLRGLLSSCIAGNLFLPGHLSCIETKLDYSGQLNVYGSYQDQVRELMTLSFRKLRKAFLKLGAVLLPGSFTVGQPGADIHYAGTLPMRSKPSCGETNWLGEVVGLSGVHVVDGTCLPILPAKSHTLMIMANADRIGRAIASTMTAEGNN